MDISHLPRIYKADINDMENSQSEHQHLMKLEAYVLLSKNKFTSTTVK